MREAAVEQVPFRVVYQTGAVSVGMPYGNAYNTTVSVSVGRQYGEDRKASTATYSGQPLPF